MALMVSCFMPLSQCTVQTRVSRLSKWQAIKAFYTGIKLRQGCDSFLLFLIIYMHWIDKRNQVDEFATIRNRKISCLLCADDLILLLQNLAFRAH